MRQEKRLKLQFYHEILCSIEDGIGSGTASPTHIRHYSRLSYDKMTNHFEELEALGTMERSPKGLLSITEKGKHFVRQYNQQILLLESAGL